MIFNSGWFVTADCTLDFFGDGGAIALIPTVVVMSTSTVGSVSFVWLCFEFSVGRTYL